MRSRRMARWAGTPSSSRRRSTTPTTCRTSVTRTTRWRWTSSRGTTGAGAGGPEGAPGGRGVGPPLEIAYDDYIRTTEPRHEAAVQQLLTAVHENGRDDIYLGSSQGLYCVACEAYYGEGDLVDGRCPIHDRPVELLREENYFFRLSAYADRLLQHYERTPSAVEPETRRNEVLSLIRGGLQDFSISRTSFP